MKLGIMQPYFFPYLGYFALIHNSDQWVVFDTPQYIRHGWVNRNRVLHPVQGWQYVLMPVKKRPLTTPICDIEISCHADWKSRVEGQLQHYRKNAPNFRVVMDVIHDCFNFQTESLANMNVYCLKKICEYLGIAFQPQLYSKMNLDIGDAHPPGDWALLISDALGAKEYINPPGGQEIFNRQAFSERGIKLTFKELPAMKYDCGKYVFEPHLSIIDVMMWKKPYEVLDYLEQNETQQ